MPASSGSSNIGNTGANETIKRLVRSASELVKRLDAIFMKVKCCKDLFTPELVELRQQLSQLCSKSLAADPLQCRRKAEELLWRKCYYNVISTAKTYSKKSCLTPQELFYLELHIDSGVARLMEHLLDATLRLESTSLPSGIASLPLHFQPLDHSSQTSNKTLVESHESTEDLLDSVQRILVWLGDLSRYKIDLGLSTDTLIAQRFYQQASMISPSNGLPYNQLGTLLSNQPKKELESIALYLRSIFAAKPFAGAGPNLQQLLDRISSSSGDDLRNLSRLISRLVLQPREDAADLGHFCQLIIASVQQKLQSDDSISSDLVDFAIVVALLSESKSANGTEAAAALGCSLLSVVLAKCREVLNLEQEEVKVQEAVEEKGEDEEEEVDELKRARIRRRKARHSDSSESDVEEAFSDDENDMFSDEDESDSSDGQSENQSEEDIQPNEVESLPNIEIPPQVQDVLLPILNILTSWLRVDKQIVATSAQSARTLWSSMATVLNGLTRAKKVENINLFERQPLPEDRRLYGLPKRNVEDFDFHSIGSALDPSAVIALRIERLTRFGHWLISEVPETGFKQEDGKFICDSNADTATESQCKKDAMMRNMATLWLKSEVQDLEEKLVGGKKPKKNQPRNLKNGKQRSRMRKTSAVDLIQLPYVYVVVDVLALTEYQPLIKRLVKSQKCIVVVPDVVLSELDQLKKESSFVRDCIRWLETCFRSGNRFLRGQRQNEHKTIPLMTYPKRKDKNWAIFQVIECCHYLDSQQREVYRNTQDAPIVLLLSGQFREGQDQQIQGICQSIGVDVKSAESISIPAKSKPGKSALQE